MEIIPGKLYRIDNPLWFSGYPSNNKGQARFITKNEYIMCLKYDMYFDNITKYHFETLICMHYNKLFTITRYINTLAFCLKQV